MKNVEDQLDDALDLAKDFLSTDKSDLVKIEVEPEIIEEISSNREDDIEEDYKSSRKNIYDLMNKGYKALDGILELAEDDESARTYEVAGQMLKTMSELNKDAIELQTRLEELKQIESNTTKNVTNNFTVRVQTMDENKGGNFSI